MIAQKIKLNPEEEMLLIEWDDNEESTISLRTLRDNCPCATCQGETILLRTYKPVTQKESAGKYHLLNIEQVGHYAIKVIWQDGHDTGIYTWDFLRNLKSHA